MKAVGLGLQIANLGKQACNHCCGLVGSVSLYLRLL